MSIEHEPGNLGDVTSDPSKRFETPGIVAVEDTRRTRKRLSVFDIHPPRMISIRADNEADQVEDVDRCSASCRNALAFDAGTPLLSDPEDRLVRAILGLPALCAWCRARRSDGSSGGERSSSQPLVLEGVLPRRGSAPGGWSALAGT